MSKVTAKVGILINVRVVSLAKLVTGAPNGSFRWNICSEDL